MDNLLLEDGGDLLQESGSLLLLESVQADIVVSRGGVDRRKKRQPIVRTVRESLREALERLYDGGDYDPPVEVLKEIESAVVAVVRQLPQQSDITPEIAAIEQLIERVQDMLRLRQVEETYPSDDVEIAHRLASEHLAEAVEATQQAYYQARFGYYARITLLLAEA